jgi:hypothetical protein
MHGTTVKICSPVNSGVRTLCSHADPRNQMFADTVPHRVHAFSQQRWDVFLTSIIRHNSSTFLQRLGLQNWVSNCSSGLLLGSLTLKMKAVPPFETSGTAYQSPQHNFSEHFNVYFICRFMPFAKYLHVGFQSNLNSFLFDAQHAYHCSISLTYFFFLIKISLACNGTNC